MEALIGTSLINRVFSIAMFIHVYLVGRFNPSEIVNWDDDIPNWMEKQNSCSKPPTRYGYIPWNAGMHKNIDGFRREYWWICPNSRGRYEWSTIGCVCGGTQSWDKPIFSRNKHMAHHFPIGKIIQSPHMQVVSIFVFVRIPPIRMQPAWQLANIGISPRTTVNCDYWYYCAMVIDTTSCGKPNIPKTTNHSNLAIDWWYWCYWHPASQIGDLWRRQPGDLEMVPWSPKSVTSSGWSAQTQKNVWDSC